MKKKYIIYASIFLISYVSIAQKDQIKAAEKSLKEGNSQEAITILQSAESLIGNAKDSEKVKFLFIKGNAFYDLANKKIDEVNNYLSSATSFNELIKVEKLSEKDIYTSQAQTSIGNIKDKLINLAIDKQSNSNYKEASSILFKLYELDKSDMSKLYFSATYALYDKDYDTALKYFEELKEKKYTGEETQYFAKSSVSGKEEYFGNTDEAKANRDSKVKLKIHSEPRDEKIPSKLGEIYKKLAYLLADKGKIQEAKVAYQEARKENPDDVNLIIGEADLYYKEKDFVQYKKLLNEALEKNPNNVELIYNLGVTSHKNKEIEEAERLYNKAISIDPKYSFAYLNLANIKLDKRNLISEQMNKLGTSALDTKKYEFLKKQSEGILTNDVLPLLEKAYELDSSSEDTKTMLLKIYGALDMTDKVKALKSK